MRWLIELIKSIINYPATLYDRWLKYYYLTPHPISRWHLDMIKKFWGLWEPSKIMSFSIFLFFLTILLYTIQNLITPRFLSTLKSNFGFEYDPWKISIFLNIDLNRLFMYPLGACQLGFFYIFFYASEKIRDIYIYLDVSVLLAHATNARIVLCFDKTSLGFLSTTLLIGYMVNYFTPYYMKNEHGELRFTNLLNAFFFSMTFLLLSNNLVTFLLFWELIGLFSFFLINYWVKKPSTFKSAMKAFTYNQLSDVMLLLATALYYRAFGTFNFPSDSIINILTSETGGLSKHTMILGFFIAASCKSAQFLYHFWLPDSMDAPVPASALIHSATLVAAGIFLITRLKPILILSPLLLKVFSYLALMTIVVGGISAANQTDLKKILAYSTISNCGFMMFLAINADQMTVITYFSCHGLLKALSFVLIGLLVLVAKHKQDLRYMGSIAACKPWLLGATLIAVSTLGAAPLTLMASIKHTLLDNIFWTNSSSSVAQLAFGIGSASSFIYSLKILNGVFYSNRHKIKITPAVKSEKIINFKTTVHLIGFTVIILKIIILFTLSFLKTKYIYIEMFDRPFDWILEYSTYGYHIEPNHKPVSAVTISKIVGICQIAAIWLITLPSWSGFVQKYTEYTGYFIWICCTFGVFTSDTVLPFLFNFVF